MAHNSGEGLPGLEVTLSAFVRPLCLHYPAAGWWPRVHMHNMRHIPASADLVRLLEVAASHCLSLSPADEHLGLVREVANWIL